MRTVVSSMILCCVISSGICLKAKDANPTRAYIESEFDKIIKEQNSFAKSWKAKISAKDNIVNQRGGDGGLSFSNENIPGSPKESFLMQIYGPQVDRKTAEEYGEALRAELASPNAMYRGLACEFLGWKFDSKSIPALAGMLEDHDASILQFVIAVSLPQLASMPGSIEARYINSLTVRLVAQNSLHELTGFSFASSSQFNDWWAANKNYTQRLWYWFTSRPYDDQRKREDEYLKLNAEIKLRIILLNRNYRSGQAEAALSMGLDPGKSDGHVPVWGGGIVIGYAAGKSATKIVADNKLKYRLIELLNQKNLYPEIQTDNDFNMLTKDIALIEVFNSEDEKMLAAAQRLTKPFKAYAKPFVEIRCRIAPDGGQSVLVESLSSNLNNVEWAQQLVAKFGSQNTDLLIQAFSIGDGNGKASFAKSVYKAADDGLPVSRKFVADLISTLTLPGTQNGITSGPSHALAALARAANVILKKQIAEEKEIIAAEYVLEGKGFYLEDKEYSKEEAKAHDSKVPEAYEALRKKLLASL
jgi:hypothetical protein